MDNNVVASPRFKDIMAEIRDLGFTPGAKLHRPGRPPVQRRVDFNQGVDARILCKDPMFLRELASICLRPLRIAFDHLGVRKPYEQAVRYAADAGLTELSNYMLYNFHDGPEDLFERMRLNVTLNEELGIRVWSFPMRYQPTDRPDRGHVGEKWTRYQLRSMQIILQATHGIVSGEPTFFRRAYGDTFAEYADILAMPHDLIFNRDWYDRHDDSGLLQTYRIEYASLDGYERRELMELLSSVDPRLFPSLPARATTRKVADILRFYVPVPKADLFRIWERQRDLTKISPSDIGVPDDERVEDAGLDADDAIVLDHLAKQAAGVAPANEQIVIGKDILELVSSSMYVDPMTIYREYVQNAADAIDEARGASLLRPDEAGVVEIGFDLPSRTIRIRDNGIGVGWDRFVRTLVGLGGSAKRGTQARGFRGVGRLAGLGYAQELIFRSRIEGETQ
eukprot:gene26385-28890_t